jgi:glycoside/pentoside/hexuronide:cation symporter, GPH family
MTRSRLLLYALGNPGFAITSQIVMSIGVYYYLPPGNVRDLAPQLSGAVYLGFFTMYGLARLIGGLIDSVAEPLVGHWSDRSRSPLGRRRVFMIAGIVPMTVAPALIFWPPGEPGSAVNFVWLSALLVVFFCALTTYAAPYLALMPEIARTESERVNLSQLIALLGFPLFMFLGPAWQIGVDQARGSGISSEHALRVAVLLLSGLAFLMCLAPILAVDERRLEHSVPSDLPLREALATTVRNGPFLIYLAAQVFFILGITMAQPLIPYLAEVVLGRDLTFASMLGLSCMPSAIAGFLATPEIVRRLGPKRTITAAVTLMGVILCALALLEPDVPDGPNDLRNLLLTFGSLILFGPGLAIFLVLPNVILGQLIDRDEARTGANRSAMFYGSQGLFTKWAYAASALLLSYLFTRFGNSQAEPLGVILVGPVGGVLCLIAAALYSLYPEEQVLAEGKRNA